MSTVKYPEYEPDALFRCRRVRGHGIIRRDQLGSYRGSIYCISCGIHYFPDLEFIGRESDIKSAQ